MDSIWSGGGEQNGAGIAKVENAALWTERPFRLESYFYKLLWEGTELL
jgi:hypothetical protein